ncbi:MAG: hypothetical protein KIC94_12265 [Clostridiales bacterium]|nr:hypothetical protein [Clostridiales bacterium]
MLNKTRKVVTKILVTTLLVTAVPSTTLPLVASAASTSIKSESTVVSQKTTFVRSQKELDNALKDKNVSAIKLYGTKEGKKVTYKLSKDCDKKLMVMSASNVRFSIPKKVKVKSLIVYVANQNELNTWKNSSRMTTLVIKTEKAVKITIGDKDFSKVHLIINAPKATIINYAPFKTINVKVAEKWMNKIETSIDDNDSADNGNNEGSSNSEGTEGTTDDTSNGGTGGGFIPGPIDPTPVPPTPIPPNPVEPTPTPIEPSEPSEPTIPEEPVVSDVAYVINFYVDSELQKTIKGDDLKQGDILKADLSEYRNNTLIEIDDELTARTQLIISSTTNIANNTLDIYYKTKVLPSNVVNEETYLNSITQFNNDVVACSTGSAILDHGDGRVEEIEFPDGQVSINLPDGYELNLNNLNTVYNPEFRDGLEVGTDNNSFNYKGVTKNYTTVLCKTIGETDYVLLVDTVNNKTYVFVSNQSIRNSDKNKVEITMFDGSVNQYVLYESIGINNQTGYVKVYNVLPGILISFNENQVNVFDSTNSSNTAVITEDKVNGIPIQR